jgi:alkanesulfonate monooxygenase SsuD/methylene tetrahydromethanopterin reductase-like flavin-dependent oxidoreductase (luciferase family)
VDFSSILLTTYVDVDSSPASDERILAAAIEQAVCFGAHGLPPWTTEHHFRGPWQPNPIQFMTHVAPQLPDEVSVGFGVLSVPFHHPVRLVEDINLLHQLTKGRAIFGLGSGFPGGIEAPGLGLDPDHHASGQAARQSIEIMERLWAYQTGDPPFSFDNGLHRGTVQRRVVPAPYRRPRPEIVRTASSDQATLLAAAKGWPIFLGVFGMDLHTQWHTYRTALAAHDHPQPVLDECLRWSTVDWLSVLVADTDDQAHHAAQTAKAERLAVRARFFEKHQQGLLGPVAGVLTSDAFQNGADLTTTIAGSPDTVAHEIQQLADHGINHLIVRFLGEWLGDTRPTLQRSLQLFADDVAPRFTDLPPLTHPLAIERRAGS